MADYEPKLTEIVTETFKDIGRAVTPTGEIGRGIKAVAKGVCEFGKGFIISTVYTGIAAYCIPTTVRKLKDDSIHLPDREYLIAATAAGNVIGTVTFLIGNGYLIYQYGPKVLLVPVATNAASYIYEKGRKTKQRLILQRREEEAAAEVVRRRGAQQPVIEEHNDTEEYYEEPESQIAHHEQYTAHEGEPNDNRTRRIDNIIDGDK
jgi:hypothetical protein